MSEKKDLETPAAPAEPSVIVDHEQLGIPPVGQEPAEAAAPADQAGQQPEPAAEETVPAETGANETGDAGDADLEAEDKEVLVGGKKKLIIKLFAVLLLAALLGLVIAFLVGAFRDINKAASKMAVPSQRPVVTMTGSDTAKVVTPAVVGADASKCKPDQWTVQEDGSIVFVNCVVPVYADQK